MRGPHKTKKQNKKNNNQKGQNGSFLKAGLAQNRHFWVFARVRALAGQNVSFFKGRACTESSLLSFRTGPGVGEVQDGSFLKAGLVQNGHFSALVLVTACHVT